MAETMVKVSRRGQITIPAELRRKLKLHKGSLLKVSNRGQTIKLGVVEDDPYDMLLRALDKAQFDDKAWEQIQKWRDMDD